MEKTNKLDNLELEHFIGYNGKYLKTVYCHPRITSLIVYPIGGLIVIEDTKSEIKENMNKQEFLRGHDMEITALDISPSGKFIASGQLGTINSKIPEAPVILWDLSQMSICNIFRGMKNGIKEILFSPDERFLAVTFCWGNITKTGKYPTYIVITTCNSNIIINNIEFNVSSMQYKLSQTNCQLPSSGLIRVYTGAFIEKNGEFLYAGTTGGEICVFNILHKIFKAAIPVSTNGVLSICSVGDYIFTGSGDGKVKRLTGKETKWILEAEIQLEGRIVSLSLSNDNKELVIGSSFGKIYKLLPSNFDAFLYSESNTESINDISVELASLEKFATVDSTGKIVVWDMNYLNIITRCVPPSSAINNKKNSGKCVCFTDLNEIAGGWEDGFIRCYDLQKTRYSPLKWEIVNAHKGAVSSLYIDVNYILSGGEDGIVRIWSRKHRNMMSQISSHTKSVVKVKPDLLKNYIIHSASMDKSVYTYDLKNEKKILLHRATNGILLDMSQRKDKELELVTCGINTPILFWDCDVTEPVEQIAYPHKLFTLEVSPKTGKYLAVGAENGEIGIFNINDNKFIGKFVGHSGSVNKLKWTADEKQIITVSSDASIGIWNFFE